MSAFEDIMNVANKVVVSAASAAKQAADGVLSSVAASSEEDKIKEAYMSIGKLYYQNKKAGTIPDGPAYEELIASIDAAQARISELKGEKKPQD